MYSVLLDEPTAAATALLNAARLSAAPGDVPNDATETEPAGCAMAVGTGSISRKSTPTTGPPVLWMRIVSPAFIGVASIQWTSSNAKAGTPLVGVSLGSPPPPKYC